MYKFIRGASPQPPLRLTVDDVQLSADMSHSRWCEQIRSQSDWSRPHDQEFEELIHAKVASCLGRSWARRGQCTDDEAVDEEECIRVYRQWDVTNATTPDLIPRVVFSTAKSHTGTGLSGG